MSRSVSAPSSVTKTSPCWNGLIVPGSTLRYGSNFWSWTRRPRALSSRPSDAATIPFPRAETTPPVTKTYFGARALTGFQGSTRGGGPLCRTDESGELRERLRGDGAADSAEPGRLDAEPRHRLVVPFCGVEIELDVDSVARQLEDDTSQRHHLEDQERAAADLRPAKGARLACSLDLPERSRRECPPHGGLGDLEPRPPLGPPGGVGEHRPYLVDRCRQDAASPVLRQGTPVRRASARARPSVPPRPAVRSACALDRRESSRHGSGGRRAPRSAEGV